MLQALALQAQGFELTAQLARALLDRSRSCSDSRSAVLDVGQRLARRRERRFRGEAQGELFIEVDAQRVHRRVVIPMRLLQGLQALAQRV
jgi:hypothetical protein